MSVQRVLTSAATLALGSLALVACDPGSATGSASTGTSTAASAPASATTSASPTAGASHASADTAAGGSGSAKASPTAAKPAGGHASGSASGSGAASGSGGGTRARLCRAGRLTVTAAPVSQPLNHLLITAKNTSGTPCDLGIIGLVTFDGRIRATTPDGLGGGPNILRPGQSNYEGVALDQQDAPGQGSDTSYLTVKLDSGDTLRIPVKAHVHAPRISVWQPSAADALSAA